MYADPFDVESQKKIEAAIRQVCRLLALQYLDNSDFLTPIICRSIRACEFVLITKYFLWFA